MKRSSKFLWLCATALVIVGCASDKHSYSPFDYDDGGDYRPSDYDDGVNGAGGEEQEYAGKVTAGEWRDLDHWDLWSELMTNPDYGKQSQQNDTQQTNYNNNEENNPYDFTTYSDYWEFYTNNRIAVRLSDAAGLPVGDVRVRLMRDNGGERTVLYTGRTDNRGEVNLWIGLTQRLIDAGNGLVLVADGAEELANVAVTGWGSEVQWNEMTTTATFSKKMDIAFIVDATGSMSDEIDFLKADLQSIIRRVEQEHSDVALRTAALFYRDEGDEYLTKASDFSLDINTTVTFISKQNAGGGGDYPEAVHTALEKGLQELSWNEEPGIRLVFMLLDAPPHHETEVIRSLQRSVPEYAAHGIRVIPVAASGVDKPTEFFLRFVATATDATYVFLTDHSGVGNSHIKATVGDYEVELLSDLMVRLINQYME